VYWKLQLAGQTTREQTVGGVPKATTQGETSASQQFPSDWASNYGRRTALVTTHPASLLWAVRGAFRDLVQSALMLSNMACAVEL